MKIRHILWACAVPLGIWLLVPLLIRLSAYVYGMFEACAKPVADSCKDQMAFFGQVGDTFGIASSLFSGLALFAVAGTLYVDVAARRSSRKPLVVCTIDPIKELTFDEPHHTNPRSIRFTSSLQVKAANDTALNVKVAVKLHVGGYTIDMGERHVQVPLLDGDSVTLEFVRRIDDIAAFVGGINAAKPMSLTISAKCQSIEGLWWETAVIYKLKFRNASDQLKLHKLEDDEKSLLETWQGDAAVALSSEIEPNSWRHSSIRSS